MRLSEVDKFRLAAFDPDGSVRSLFDRNWARRMEDMGFLEYLSGCMDGSRSYELTEAGRAALAEEE